MQPKVSVIIPNYNHAPYLRERIDSVLTQTFRDFEVILLDDCSSDNSRDIIEGYRHNEKVSHIVFNTENSGNTFIQWKRGLALACGKYIWIAESDDFATPDFLETLVPLLDSNPKAAIAFSGSRIVDRHSRDIPGANWDHWPKNAPEIEMYTPQMLTAQKLLRNCLVYNASMVVFRKDMAPEITDEQTKMRLCGDWLFWSEIARRGGAVEVRRKMNAFRQHEIKVSATALKAGLTYTEGVPIVARMADFLNLSPLQRRVIAGRLFKRLRKFPKLTGEHPEILKNIDRISPGASSRRRILMALYEFDKIFNFSHLPAQQ